MRTNLFRPLFFLLAVIMLSACEKTILSEDDDAGKDTPPKTLKGNLILRVSGFEILPFDDVTRAKEELKKVCTRLCFAVYDMSGKKVKYENQKAEDAVNYGSVGFELDEGTYHIAVVAHSSKGNPTMSNERKIDFSNNDGFSDTFYYYSEVTIGSSQKSVEVVLKRAVSMFRLISKDVVPNNLQSVSIVYTGGSAAFDLTTGYGCENSRQTVQYSIDQSQKGNKMTFEFYTFLHADAETVSFNVKSLNGISYRELNLEVPMEYNKITQYTGYLFSDPPQDGEGGDTGGGDNTGGETPDVNPSTSNYVFPLMVETEWEGTIEMKF